MPGDEPKIIIDSDWKSQAQAEKERLSQQAAPAKQAPAPGQPGPEGPVSFDEIVRMLAMQALSYLGEIPDPRTNQRVFAPEYAKLYIDMLGVLEEKTKGNLTKEEDETFKALLNDLRFAYVDMSKAVAKAVQEGKIKPQAGGPAGAAAPTIELPKS